MNSADGGVGLDQLRGLHLPGGAAGALQAEMVGAVALGFLAALAVGLVRRVRARRRETMRRAALQDLAALSGLGAEERLVAQARLLRRLARTLRGDAAAARQGSGWAAELDALLRTDFFTGGAGRIFAEGLYRPEASDPQKIDAELGRLIGRMQP